MCDCNWSVLLWLILVLAASDGAWPQCGPDARACVAAAPRHAAAGWHTRDYVVDGKLLHFAISSPDKGEVQVWRCERSPSSSLGEAAPAFVKRHVAAAVHLVGCHAPPDSSYAELLQRLNLKTTRLSITSHSTRSFDALRVKSTLTELTVHSDRLVKLENDFAHLATLEMLSLKKISMTTDQFMSMRNIVELSLVECGLEEIPDLSRFIRLRQLTVRDGRLLDARRLATARALRTLVLDAPDAALDAMPRLHNATFIDTYVMDSIFGNCSELKSLSVLRGSLRELRAGFLAGCVRLLSLDLSHGTLETLPKSLLADGVALTLLDLSYNRLRALPGDLLEKTTRLTRLDVSHNLLETIPDDFLKHADRLSHVDFAHNRLTAVPDALLSGMPALKHLNLSHNQLTVLPESLIAAVEKGLDFDVSQNNFSENPRVASTAAQLFKRLDFRQDGFKFERTEQ